MKLFFGTCLVGFIAYLWNTLQQNGWHVEAIQTEEGFQMLFKARSDDDWRNVWHKEQHSRCRDHLEKHLLWACEKDIYRIEGYTDRNTKLPYWINLELAQSLLRTMRKNTPTISKECCSSRGCTWEEYAEYCPSNKRLHHISFEVKQ